MLQLRDLEGTWSFKSQGLNHEIKKSNAHDFARWTENFVALWFQAQGWELFKKRVRRRGFELDLVMVDPIDNQALVIEVKGRRHRNKPATAEQIALLMNRSKEAAIHRGLAYLTHEQVRHGESSILSRVHTWNICLALLEIDISPTKAPSLDDGFKMHLWLKH